MIERNEEFNISPKEWDNFDTLGQHATFLTDKHAIVELLGEKSLDKPSPIINSKQAQEIEKRMGLERGSLGKGFKVRRVTGLLEKGAHSLVAGNAYFLGKGVHLPGGHPDVAVRRIRTTDGDGVHTILHVEIE